MFIETLQTNPVFYVSSVVALILSITLHELAHGWAALRKGDDTPRYLGHMTPNPITHMGPIGFFAVFLLGIGWGAMPVTPSRLRGKYAEAFVAFAGPLMNLLLALIGLTILAIWIKSAPTSSLSPFHVNLREALWYFGHINVALFLFNLAPVPPLDGSRILADVYPPYRRWLHENEHAQQFMFIAYMAIVMSLSRTKFGLFTMASNAGQKYLDLWM